MDKMRMESKDLTAGNIEKMAFRYLLWVGLEPHPGIL